MSERLVCYGSLQPGGAGFAALGEAGQGQWQPCHVRGHLHEIGPYKVMALDMTAPTLPMQLLTSDALPACWAQIDEYEGQAYQRVRCTAETAEGPVTAYIYIASGLPLEDEAATL